MVLLDEFKTMENYNKYKFDRVEPSKPVNKTRLDWTGVRRNGVKKMKLQIRYLENGKTKHITVDNTAQELELWNRQRAGEVSIIDAKKVN